MRVTHLGHACLLVEVADRRILIDPGNFSSGFEELTGLDAIVVTHNHPDHFDPERVPDDREQSYHMYYLLMPSLEARTTLIQYLRELGILSVFHYLPLHLSDMGRKFGGQAGDCPVTEDVSDRLVRLPLYNELTEDDQALVIHALKRFEGW